MASPDPTAHFYQKRGSSLNWARGTRVVLTIIAALPSIASFYERLECDKSKAKQKFITMFEPERVVSLS